MQKVYPGFFAGGCFLSAGKFSKAKKFGDAPYTKEAVHTACPK